MRARVGVCACMSVFVCVHECVCVCACVCMRVCVCPLFRLISTLSLSVIFLMSVLLLFLSSPPPSPVSPLLPLTSFPDLLLSLPHSLSLSLTLSLCVFHWHGALMRLVNKWQFF